MNRTDKMFQVDSKPVPAERQIWHSRPIPNTGFGTSGKFLTLAGLPRDRFGTPDPIPVIPYTRGACLEADLALPANS